MIRINPACLFLSVSLSLLSCGGVSDEKADKNRTDSLPETDSVATGTTRNFFYSLPSPLAMAAVYKSSGMKYNEALINPADKVSKYNSQRSMALNMGVYHSDLAYTLINGQTQLALKYLDVIKTLSDGLKMSSIFDTEEYVKRFRDNVNHIDSLKKITADLKGEADLFLYDNNRHNTALFIFTGAWTESMYIATQSVKSGKSDLVVTTVAEQKYILDNLMTLLSDYEKEPTFKDLFLELNNVKISLDKMVRQGENEEARVEINEGDLNELTEKVVSLRTKIISE
ncbi:MAG: hypothetical protein AB1458_13410 [Bacteroidota bacterium]